ncbi:MAG: helix-hairpin-helix domain-containing protein [Gracilimonas sp.]|uniref:phospholipase D-like domain-containing protein n=1 Tax=Gracilimonas TaxID=649462 RepID=UPI001B220F2E|nr:phospholipase D-like domain-containing protein [Gracilimonas sp.]MBO6584981.1 helix-hairpin-helix domain-containing protein [Gracilimonas sp.]MBO6615748.1 helix-hairpin-helix domain-containing protein [Gracilimonas sp.]
MKKLTVLIGSFTLMFSTLSAYAQSDEWIQVYFNMPADHNVAAGNNLSNSNQDLIGSLEQLIDSATTSIDFCIYDFEHPRIAHALVRAKNRGVRIRVVTDDHNRTDGGDYDLEIWTILATGGILSMDDDGDIYNPDGTITDNDLVNDGSDMHNKFAVIDYLSPSPDDDYVWTGSTNMTLTGAYNTNHTLVIKDTEVAKAYTEEFEQMWGDSDETPEANRAVFHKDKRNVSQNVFDVGGTRVEVYFAPVNRDRSKPSVSERLVSLIRDEAQHDINFQAFAITPDIPISRQMWEQSSTGEVLLRGAIDRSFYSRYQSAGEIWGIDSARMNNRMILPANELRKLHHKVILLDAEHPDSADIGVTVAGSYNFSMNAEMNNDENTVIIFSDEITNQFYQDFMGVMKRAKEEAYPPAPPLETDRWYEVFSITDGSRFEIEIAPGFGYGVRFLGVDVPTIYAGQDSAEFYSGAAADYLHNLLEGRKVRLKGFDGGKPEARYNAFQAYVEMQYDDGPVSLNKMLLEKGFGTTSVYYRQNDDSVAAFKRYQESAKAKEEGLWKHSEKIGSKTLRAEEVDTGSPTNVMYPININTADEATLQLLPGIGPAYSKRIVQYRLENGSFKSVDEITNIRGIGPKTLQKLRPIITLE